MAAQSNAAAPGPADPTPPAVVAQPPAPPRETFRSAPVGWVIAAMLLFWPTGIPALLASHRAARAFGAADVEGAQRESANARRWGIISVVVGACLIVFSMLAWAVSLVVLVLVAHHIDDDGIVRDGPGWSSQQPFGDQGPFGNG